MTGLEPAASGVTGQRSNQLSYTPALSQMRWICLMQLARSVNYSIRQSVELTKFLEKELELRKKNFLPPFSRLIAIIISSDKHTLSLDGAREIKNQLIKINEIEVMGPVDSPLLKIRRKFRSRLLIRFKGNSLIQKKITNLLNTLKISNKIKLIVDVDPVNFG